ncbi:MAG: hypothetical protein IKM76_11130 [Prevotella sp.]|nr:hypothetical protein [Prevotella sp.]
METMILRVVSQQAVTYVPSQKAEGGRLAKSMIRLKELGGKYENEYLVTLLGNLAGCVFGEGELVIGSLSFRVREINGLLYQDLIANDLIKLVK